VGASPRQGRVMRVQTTRPEAPERGGGVGDEAVAWQACPTAIGARRRGSRRGRVEWRACCCLGGRETPGGRAGQPDAAKDGGGREIFLDHMRVPEVVSKGEEGEREVECSARKRAEWC
jgi:hypothetical protein